MVDCPRCKGQGVMDNGKSVQSELTRYYGGRGTHRCECCLGTGKVGEGTDPNWWKVSDNSVGGR